MESEKEISFPKSTFWLLCSIALIPFLAFLYNFVVLITCEPKSISSIILGIIFLIFFILILNEAFRKVTIDKDAVTSKTKLYSRSKKIKDIKGYSIVNPLTSNPQNKNKVLYLYSDKGKMTFNSDNWGDKFEILCTEIGKIIPQKDKEVNRRTIQQQKNIYKNIGISFGFLFSIAGIILIFWERPIKSSNTRSFSVTLKEIWRKKEVKNYVALEFIEYPSIYFAIRNTNYELSDLSVLKLPNNKKLDIIVVRSEWEKLVLESSKRSSGQKSIIDIQDIRDTESIYLNLEEINYHRGPWGNKKWFILLGITIMLYYRFISKGYD